ncbi:MAG: glycosyltransferase, partial [Burkholderiales bacterium]|nr:glycosyltransferase [Burkholderiales bacterium]
MAARRRVVLAWPAFANRKVNPYNALLYAGVQQAGWDVREFSWRRVLLERHDVWHVHWPEDAVNQRDGVRSWLRLCGFVAALLQSRLTGRKVVWTLHNLRPHESRRPTLQSAFRRVFLRSVDLVLALTESGRTAAIETYPVLARALWRVVPHGHYRDVYPPAPPQVDARRALGLPERSTVFAFVGLMKPYKNVPGLLRAFAALDDADARLLVAGLCPDKALADEIAALAAADARVQLHLGFLDEDAMARTVAAADCVVLPYTEILNSGVALLALSLGRPVVVPRLGALRELADLCGPDWAVAFDGTFDTAVLAA